MGKPVVFWELWSKAPQKVSAFYRDVFDWEVSRPGSTTPALNFHMMDTRVPGGVNGAIMTPPQPEPWPGNMSMYIGVDDLAAYRKRIIDAGGSILLEEQHVPGMGAFALFSDPDGRVVGLWKDAKKT